MRVWLLLLSILILGACSPFEQKSTYDETKKMVIDVQQTEDGKKALRDTLGDPTFQEMLVLEQDVVKKSVETTLLSEDGKAFWEHSMQDPKFMDSMAKRMTAQQKELEKLLKSSSLREEMKKVVEETIQNPVWTAYWPDLVMKAAEAGKGTGGSEGGPSGGGDGAGGSSGDGGAGGGGQ